MTDNITEVLKSCPGIPSGAEARQLSRDWKAGDWAAREALIVGNMPMVAAIIERMRVPERLVDDAFEEGMIGLMRAVDKYDADHPSHAVFCTVAVHWVRQAIQQMMRKDIRRTQRETGLTGVEVEIEEVIVPPSVDVEPMLRRLSKRERHAMRSVTDGLKLREVAEEMAVTKERVRQIRNRAIDKLRGMVR